MKEVYYSQYLQLDKILGAQERTSGVHDEYLFIITHQSYELWFKQIILDLDSMLEIFSGDNVDDREISKAELRLNRVIEIQKLLIQHIGILETMTPMDFLEFRERLAPASGFQSFQFRLLENKLGLKWRNKMAQAPYFERLSEEHQKLVRKTESEPTLLEAVDRWLKRTPFVETEGYDFWETYRTTVRKILDQDEEVTRQSPHLTDEEQQENLKKLELNRQTFDALFDRKLHEDLLAKGKRHMSYDSTIAALFILMFREQPVLQLPYRILSNLIDMDELFTNWRYRHALLAERMIGGKIGTGGSTGYDYLKKTVESHKVFTDLTRLASFLVPRSSLPPLPPEFEKKLGFTYSVRNA